MNIHNPKCCGQLMQKWIHKDKRRTWTMWRCIECEKERDLYSHWWRHLWLTVARSDILDEFYQPSWWLGAVGSLHNLHCDTLTFTVIPFNRIVDGAVRAYQWLRFCKRSRWTQELERAKREGHADGQSQMASKIYVAKQIATAETREENTEDMNLMRQTLALVILASGGKVEIPKELLAVTPNNLELGSTGSLIQDSYTLTARIHPENR